jgi:hypothetical protein
MEPKFIQFSKVVIIDTTKVTAVKFYPAENTDDGDKTVESIEIFTVDGKFFLLYRENARKAWELFRDMALPTGEFEQV